MARDYANRRNGGNGKRGGRNGGMPGWVWAFVGLTAGLLVATALYIRKPVPHKAPKLEPEATGEAAKPDDSRFDFYEMLPEYEVKVPRSESPPAGTAPAEAKQPGAYIIQAGSFRTFEDADRLKASLALLGIESHIEKSEPDTNGQIWHRVRTDPEKNLAVVNEQLRLMRENRIEGVLVKAN